MENKSRQSGYYWVKFESDWIIAEYDIYWGWYLTKLLPDSPIQEHEIDEIDETPIVRNDKN